MNNRQVLALPIGLILLAIAILIERFLPASDLLDFIVGVLTGISIVLNIFYIFAISKKRKGNL